MDKSILLSGVIDSITCIMSDHDKEIMSNAMQVITNISPLPNNLTLYEYADYFAALVSFTNVVSNNIDKIMELMKVAEGGNA